MDQVYRTRWFGRPVITLVALHGSVRAGHRTFPPTELRDLRATIVPAIHRLR